MESRVSELGGLLSLIQTGQVSVDVSFDWEACTYESVHCTINS